MSTKTLKVSFNNFVEKISINAFDIKLLISFVYIIDDFLRNCFPWVMYTVTIKNSVNPTKISNDYFYLYEIHFSY